MALTKQESTLSDGRFEELYRTDAKRLWWALVAYTGDRELARDAVAEAFAQALRRGEAIRSPAAWVRRAAFRIAAGELARRTSEAREEIDTSYEMPEPAFDVVRGLATLPRKQRACVVLYYYLDIPTTEIGRILQIAPTTVGVHLLRARRALRPLLEEGDGS